MRDAREKLTRRRGGAEDVREVLKTMRSLLLKIDRREQAINGSGVWILGVRLRTSAGDGEASNNHCYYPIKNVFKKTVMSLEIFEY